MKLTATEKNILETVYGRQLTGSVGYNPNQIEKVEELTTDEKVFFAQKQFISPYFSVQTLYKVQGDITPIKFNRVVHDMVKSDDTFRSNFCELENRTVRVIFVERRTLPDVVYRALSQADPEEIDETLTKIMEADRRVNFDVKRGNLIRFTILKTEENEFAVLVTMSRLISNAFDPKNFFLSALGIEKFKRVKKISGGTQQKNVETAIRDYWSKLLKDLPQMPTLPYAKHSNAPYNPKAFRENIPADILSDLREKAKSSRVMLMTILQSAWGFFLQSTRTLDDVIFCQFSAGSKGNESAFNVIPVRQKSPDDMTIEQIITQQFRQLVVSQPYGFSDWDTLQELTKGKTFDHFLSFLDFKGTKEATYSETKAEPFGAVVTTNSWDPQGVKLGIYFQYAETTLSLTFLYDANKFFQNAGERFARIYNLVLRQMLVHWHSPFKTFMEKLMHQMKIETEEGGQFQSSDDKKTISNFIVQHPILQGSGGGTLAFFADSTQLVTKFEGDRIYGDILRENLIFVVEGKLARSLDKGDGWFKALDIISKGGWINENVFIQNPRTIISAEVLTEQAKLLIVPLEKTYSLFLAHPDTSKPFFDHVLKQMEKYQLLWIQS
ncbi:MAG: hypothetical protein IJT06_00245 [Selenomonadaceae bacterium]|nr:hypothetical protein [Selenomonadaceae bacterium]